MTEQLTRRAQARAIREALRIDEVLTSVQLERRGWIEGLPLARVYARDLSVRVKAAHPTGDRHLTFLTRTGQMLDDRTLVHRALLAEMRHLLPDLRVKVPLPVGEHWRWKVLSDQGKDGNDAEIVQLGHVRGTLDWAVEADTGYPVARVIRKVQGIGATYDRLLWAVSVPGRVERTLDMVQDLDGRGQLGCLRDVVVRHVDISAVDDPYQRWPVNKNYKPLERHYRTRRGRAEASAGM